MKKIFLASLSSGLVSTSLSAATIAVIDSGYDYEHEALAGRVWQNAQEIPGDKIDNDGNGKIDDVYGWNFVDNNELVIDYTLQDNYHPDIEKFLELQLAAARGEATEGEKIWLSEQLRNPGFVKKLQTFGTYAHGTHVAGIIAKDYPEAKLIAAKMISPSQGFWKLREKVRAAIGEGQDLNFIKEFVIKLGLWGIAYQQSQSLGKIVPYLHEQGVTVANGSFGIGMEEARGLVAPILILLKGEPADDALIEEYASFFITKIAEEQAKILKKYPDILFVFAAGNESSDNDSAPVAPAVVRLDNVISVGATAGNTAIAPFSNFGASRVDLFAPGVGVLSSVPQRDLYLPFSGTSMAAPAVARAAALIRDRNPKLSPLEIREILRSTVDRKSFLKGMAYAEGVVNEARALYAADKAAELTLKEAIQEAKSSVADKAAQAGIFSENGDYSFITPF